MRSGTQARHIVVGSVCEAEAQAAAARLQALPDGCAWAEIRGDELERAQLLELVRACNRPRIVTLRRPEDGGRFRASEALRRRFLLDALEAGADWIDVEWTGGLRDLADGEHARRVILSHHGARCVAEELLPLYRAMRATRAARLKIVPLARRPAEILAVRDLLALARADGVALSCFAMGRSGALSRLLAPGWGSWGSYASAAPDRPTAPGQFSVADMLEIYDVCRAGPQTRWFALVGNAVFGSPSPAMHAAAFRECALDARYVPLEADAFDEIAELCEHSDGLGLDGLAVTIPFKEQAANWSTPQDPVSRAAAAVNTVRLGGAAREGFNTDGPGAVALAERELEPRGSRVLVLGAGGTARAVAAAFRQRGAHVALSNRTAQRGACAADELGVEFVRWDERRSFNWDVLVQATPLGRHAERVLEPEDLRGRLVIDAVYGVETPLIADSRAVGLAVADGLDLLVAQGLLQFERLTGRTASPRTLRRAAERWLQSRSPGGSA